MISAEFETGSMLQYNDGNGWIFWEAPHAHGCPEPPCGESWMRPPTGSRQWYHSGA
jgi:hypothetical protein